VEGATRHLPNLLTDIAAIVDSQSQADPQFRTQRLYTRLDAAEMQLYIFWILRFRE
jgi:hypothetical protein